MTSSDIVQSIQNWEAIRQDSVAMIDYFEKGNCFSYNFPAYAQSSNFIHAYPGIYNDELYFFVIPAEYDKEEYSRTIDQYTEACLLVNIVGDGENRLTPAEAQARILAWKKDYKVWIPEQVGSQYGIFEAFAIPAQDFEVENVIISLGLKVEASAAGGYEADLIVTNDEGKQIVYDDYTTVVPPFGALPTASDFYLLSANI